MPAQPTFPQQVVAYDFAEVTADAILREKVAMAARLETMRRSDIVKIIREQDALRLDKPAPKARARPIPSAISSTEKALVPDIYEAYPKHVGKEDAVKAIAKAIKLVGEGELLWAGFDTPAHYLLARVQKFAAAVNRWPSDERKFVPHPASWFNAGRYADEDGEWVRGRGLYSNAARASASAIPEPSGWKAWIDANRPESVYASTGTERWKSWAQLDRSAQSYICEQMNRQPAT